MFLVAAAITVVIAGILIANVQGSGGQGVKVSNDTLDQLTSIIIQLMVVFWVALIGYFVYKYLTTREKYRSKGERRGGQERNLLPYAFVLLALWLILFVVSPIGGGGLFNSPEQVGRSPQTNSTLPTDQPTRDLPLAFPLIIVIIALASVVVVWRFLRRSEAPRVNVADRTKDEAAKEVLDAAVRSLYAGEDPRSTIIRTYQRMCLLVQVGKLDDEPFLTPREFADRAVGALGWKRAPLEDLTELFEEARYSTHVLGEADKERAIAAFERVREGLGGAPAAGTAQ